MDIEKKKKQFIPKPIYPGGSKAMKAFVSQELKYPQEARSHNIEGRVHLKYEIDHKGTVIAAKIISGLGHGCDKEAKRIVRLFKFLIPDIPRKRKLKFFKKITISFKLPEEKKVQKQSIRYTITELRKQESPSTSYHYTVKF